MAFDEILDEHEQSERVLAWLRRNAAALIGGIALGLALIFGWQWWQGRQQSGRAEAATQYQQLVDAFEAGNLKDAGRVASLDGPLYRALGGLALAKAQLQANQREAAIDTLKRIDAADPALDAIVAERHARLLIDAGQGARAIELLAGATGAGALEARGDAQFALGQVAQARESYTKALSGLDVDAPQRRLLELKLTQVGGTPTKSEAKS